ncbi:alpha/beta hydrolase [Granulicella sp. WH15]|uniref:alpha/beta fold hydrolase n=1 Tax=Granulicella sp. WH15 TaxID=2602070 RepID=UPI001366E280|nr:alpha/beta hydrolase [Granulicella sp. WH15]QHN04712.1 alpha/beta hydrolase [Granulicella sp. WH15]
MTTNAASEHSSTVHYNTVRIENVDIFYREAGKKGAPVLLLLHGFPTSSNMFRNLISRLSGSFHIIAPDYPGYGFSSMPDRAQFSYTFEKMTDLVEQLTIKLELSTYIIYVMDYGAPIGYRLAIRHPEKIAGIIVQNGNAYDEGLREFWDPIKKYWGAATPENRAALEYLTKPDATKWQYENGVADKTLVDPTTYTLDQAGMDRPGNADIQLDMLYDYRTNVPFYPAFQEFFRKFQPPMLIVWGKNDFIFPPEGAAPYKRDLPKVETHLLDAGHFALETHGEEIASRIEGFFSSK